jgi:hypothetical protein
VPNVNTQTTQSSPKAGTGVGASEREPQVIPTGQCVPGGTPAENFRSALDRLAELKEYASYFVAAKLDALKLTVRNVGIYAVLGLIGGIVAATMAVVAVVLLLVGAAHGIGAALGGMYWLGDLIIGVFILGLIAVGAVLGLKMLTRSFKKSTVDKYETRQHQQRRNFGHDVEQRARNERDGPTSTR